MTPGQTHKAAEYVRIADVIGREIVRSAIWHGERCSWIGAMPAESPDGRMVMTHVAFGADLYGGTAGVGLFLAQLHALAGGEDVRRTAIGALRQTAMRAGHIVPAAAQGLYAGRVGAAFALARASALLNVEELRAHAVHAVPEDSIEDAAVEFDLISGVAGGIVGYLTLARMLDNPGLMDRARRLGDSLVSRAEHTQGRGVSWHSPAVPTSANLTGFSHGASGAGQALLELAAVTGESSYGEIGRQAFAYEQGVYDPTAQNWPDFRQSARQPGISEPSFATFWCHGAPGIALSRIRACELVHDNTIRSEALIALKTTRSWVGAALASGLVNYSLCHGVAGNAEVILEGRELLGPDGGELPLQAAEIGIERYAAPQKAWPCGTHEGSTANLFLGLAGIGYFYLRLASPSVPSLLLVRPDRFV